MRTYDFDTSIEFRNLATTEFSTRVLNDVEATLSTIVPAEFRRDWTYSFALELLRTAIHLGRRWWDPMPVRENPLLNELMAQLLANTNLDGRAHEGVYVLEFPRNQIPGEASSKRVYFIKYKILTAESYDNLQKENAIERPGNNQPCYWP